MRFWIVLGLVLSGLIVGQSRDCWAQGMCATGRCFSSGECGSRCFCGKSEPGGHGFCVLR